MFSSVIRTNKYEVASYANKVWLKVFFHNHTTRVNFKNEKEAKHCNSQYKYSILDKINTRMKINSKYEFIMDFPDESDAFIHWEQDHNPVEEMDGKSQADGFNIIDDKGPSASVDFKGLTLSTIRCSNKINCFLDGVPSSGNWYYAIGMYEDSEGNYKTEGIPAYKSHVKSIRLWIRMNPMHLFKRCTQNYHHKTFSKYLLIICFVINS